MKKNILFIVLTLALIVAALASLSLGAAAIPLRDVLTIIGAKMNLYKGDISAQYEVILWVVRLPRLLLGILVGAALGISGAAIQGIFRNPLAEPGLIGISAGASLFAAIVLAFEVNLLAGLGNTLGYFSVSVAAFVGAVLSAILVYSLSRSNGRPQIATMLLSGIAINAFASALTGLIASSADEQQLRSITFWMLGSLAGATWENLAATLPFIGIPLLLLPTQGRRLNAFVLGEKQADIMGMRTGRTKLFVIVLTTMAVGAAVAVSGVIGFVGLLVPHTIRLMGGVDNRFVLPASALLGATTLCLADLLARVVTAPIEQPIGVVTALLGTPVFLYILLRDKKKMFQG